MNLNFEKCKKSVLQFSNLSLKSLTFIVKAEPVNLIISFYCIILLLFIRIEKRDKNMNNFIIQCILLILNHLKLIYYFELDIKKTIKKQKKNDTF